MQKSENNSPKNLGGKNKYGGRYLLDIKTSYKTGIFFQNTSVAYALPQSSLLLSSCEPETWRHLFPFRGLFSSSFLPLSYTPHLPTRTTLF